jgi:hypothetical protein
MAKQCPRCMRFKNADDDNICGICELDLESKQSINTKNTEWLDNYGNVSAARLDELNRRTLVYDKDGKEHLCRKGENGKIQDRHPDYY